MKKKLSYDIIIVGGGPVGLTLANLLGLRNLWVLVLEQQTQRPDQPRAVSLDDESLRIWQQCGLINEILPFVAQGDEGDQVFTYRSYNDKPIFSLRQRGRPYGYARGNVFLFHRVLDVLLNGLGRFPRVEYRPGIEVVDFTQTSTNVTAIGQNNEGEKLRFTGSYLIGCDGGRSLPRTQLGIPLDGIAYQESWLIADTFSPSRTDQPLREGVEVWCDADCPTATIPLPGGLRRWEFLLRQAVPEAEFSNEAIERLIARHKPFGDARIVRSLVHTYKAQVSRTYRDGKVLLAGDAAPPLPGREWQPGCGTLPTWTGNWSMSATEQPRKNSSPAMSRSVAPTNSKCFDRSAA